MRDPWADARQAATEKVLVVVVVIGIGGLVGRSLDDVRLPSGDARVGRSLFGLVWQVVVSVRDQVRARQGRRWLARNA